LTLASGLSQRIRYRELGGWGQSIYDGMIVAAAERAGCARILSEDFNAGQKYFGVMVTNPFS
jgi:predicted nucleic acid-binding protein